MTQEISRRLINGVWTTDAEDESSGGGGLPAGGTTGEVLTKASDADGDTEWAAGGGSQAGAVRWLGPCKTNCFAGQVLQVSGSGSIAGGAYTITVNGETTSSIAWDATAASILAALNALPSIDGKAILDPASGDQSASGIASGNYALIVVFTELVATGIATIDTSALTGADAPYTDGTLGSNAWAEPMLTPAVGDIIEDFMHRVPAAFAEGARLLYTDTPANAQDGPPVWAMPVSGQGVDGLDLTTVDEFTNFSGNGSGGNATDVLSRPTALSALIAQWAESASETNINLYQNLPAMALNAAPIYAYIKDVEGSPTDGEVWIWVKVSTPAALDD